ncbi:hypothetical protein LTR36_006184 [Oleoguttula mirabilis]|uniref:non-specific serine/threonine protein kinase n=1 Tax=Oleoguttula mirabilis TaxID=1507867 RepID=A0AAV9JCJ5_9PEZI|nr:hypothetical protein LTR36_006184 [Oleoguttula mirabilis]
MPPKKNRTAKGADGLTDKQAYLRAESQRISDEDEGAVSAAEATKTAERTWNALGGDEAKEAAVAEKRVWWAAREAAAAAAPAAAIGGREVVDDPVRGTGRKGGAVRQRLPTPGERVGPQTSGGVLDPGADVTAPPREPKGKGRAGPQASRMPAAPGGAIRGPGPRRPQPERDLDDLKQKSVIPEARKRKAEDNPPTWPDGRHWESGGYLGGGAFGQAFLYVARNEHHTVTDRKVVKDCYVKRIHYGHVQHWYGDPSNPAKRKHMEIKAMELIGGLPGSDKCVKIFRSEEEADGMFYRIYMNYCPHGSLQMLIEPDEAYKKATDATATRTTKAPVPQLHWERRIPEPFLWSVFEAMVEACTLLEYGGLESEQFRPGWERIVHRDIKLPNIFLDTPDAGRWPSYPKAQLGDFGMAVITSDGDPMNPTAYNDQEGTTGWMPQEMYPMLDRETKYPFLGDKLDQKTNVWGIGAVVLRLMNREWATENKQNREMYSEEDRLGEPLVFDRETEYSEELRGLARDCVSYDPGQRPELVELRRRVAGFVAEARLGQGMRDRAHGDHDEDDELKLWYQEDGYKDKLLGAGA